MAWARLGPVRPATLPNPSLLSIGQGRPGPPKPLTLSTGPGPAWPSPTPHMHWQLPHFSWQAQTPHFHWPGRARQGASNSRRAGRAIGGQGRPTNPLWSVIPLARQARFPPSATAKSGGGCVCLLAMAVKGFLLGWSPRKGLAGGLTLIWPKKLGF